MFLPRLSSKSFYLEQNLQTDTESSAYLACAFDASGTSGTHLSGRDRKGAVEVENLQASQGESRERG